MSFLYFKLPVDVLFKSQSMTVVRVFLIIEFIKVRVYIRIVLIRYNQTKIIKMVIQTNSTKCQ